MVQKISAVVVVILVAPKAPVPVKIEALVNHEDILSVGDEFKTLTDDFYKIINEEERLFEIEKLEKRKMEDQHFKTEPPSNPQAFLNWAIVLAFISWGTKYFMFRISE